MLSATCTAFSTRMLFVNNLIRKLESPSKGWLLPVGLSSEFVLPRSTVSTQVSIDHRQCVDLFVVVVIRIAIDTEQSMDLVHVAILSNSYGRDTLLLASTCTGHVRKNTATISATLFKRKRQDQSIQKLEGRKKSAQSEKMRKSKKQHIIYLLVKAAYQVST